MKINAFLILFFFSFIATAVAYAPPTGTGLQVYQTSPTIITPTFSGTATGNISGSSGTVATINGLLSNGTGITLTGTGTTASPYTISSSSTGGSGTVTSVAVSGGTTGLTTSGGPITGSGTITLSGNLAIANGGTGGNATTYQTNLQVASALNLPHWRAALARVASGTGTAKVFIIGDSQSLGYNNGMANNLLTSYPAMLMNMFNGAHIPATFENRIGDTLITDGRFTIGSWTDLGTMIVGGNQATYATAATSTAQSFTSTTPINSCNLIYYAGANAGAFSWQVDGGSSTTITETINTISSATVTMPLGVHKVGVNWVSGIPGFIGFDCSNTTIPAIDVIDAAATGTTTANWSSSTLTAGSTTILQSTTFLNQDLTVIMLGGNDWCTLGEGATQFGTNLQAIITQAKTVGDVLLVATTPTNPITNASGACSLLPSTAAQAAYIAVEPPLALSNNVPYLDIFDRWVSWNFSSASPYLYYESDGLHATPTGINDLAQAFSPFLISYGPINTVPAPFNVAGTGLASLASSSTISSNAAYQISYDTGAVASVTTTKTDFSQVSKASTVDNIIGSTRTFTCSVNPTVTLYECGTSTTCATPTTIGSVTVTATGTATVGTISSSAITAGDYVGFAVSAGACTVLSLSVKAQIHSN